MKEIRLLAGAHIDECYADLLQKAEEMGEPVFGRFNGIPMYSNESLDAFYIRLTGMPKSVCEEMQRAEKRKMEERRKQMDAKRPQFIEEYRNKARGVIAEKDLSAWDELVPMRVSDIYYGAELGATLELIAILNQDKPLDERLVQAEKTFDMQGHSGASAMLVLALVNRFHEDGKQFYERNTSV